MNQDITDFIKTYKTDVSEAYLQVINKIDYVTEDVMIERLISEVNRRYRDSKLQTPDYRKTNFYAPQWKVSGRLYYYKVVGDFEPIIAAFVQGEFYLVNERGIDTDFLRQLNCVV